MELSSEIQVDYLSKMNKHDRDDEITFVPEGHIYMIKGETSKPISVTTLTYKNVWAPFDANAVITRIMDSEKYKSGNSEYSGMSKWEIKRKWDKAGEEARVEGTKLHDKIEKYYNEKMILEEKNAKRRSERLSKKRKCDDNEKEKRIEGPTDWMQFMRFAESDIMKNMVPYRTEWKIFSRVYNIAGAIDMIFLNKDTNTLEIYDWKRSKEISQDNYNRYAIHPVLKEYQIPDANYYKYSMQLSVYKYILETEYDLPYKLGDMYLVRMDTNEEMEKAERIEAAYMKEEIESLLKTRVPPK
tara:strand:- start:3623 stop:4519 length:897 start_codon:yes stop_codon:yes gene_type:complete